PPDPGVYEWLQCGRSAGQCTGEASEPEASEAITGISRPLPRRGLRTIVVSGPSSWTLGHAYAAEHYEEAEVSRDASAFYFLRLRVDLSLLIQKMSVAIIHNPPLKGFQIPAAQGSSWGGRFDDAGGAAVADYSSTVVGKEEIEVGGQKIRTWLVETNVRLLGPMANGDIQARLWFAPELGATVQEYKKQSLADAQGLTYSSEWMITLASLNPRT
ncbi:MAG: hypothetical protein ACRDIF_02400, partial [Actinomycetota bacterium]